jgi:hypothetical protein
MYIDVFNGDADGICALIQLRLAEPIINATLISGVKRDTQLLNNVSVQANDLVTVLDVSLKKNRPALDNILQQGAFVFYVDHHETGEIPIHPNLKTIINTKDITCTSLLVDHSLSGKYSAWALTGAFGDNLMAKAEQLAKTLFLTTNQFKQLKSLGTCINYNSYGSSIADLYFAPDKLYQSLAAYKSPFEFINDNPVIYEKLLSRYQEDMIQAQRITPEYKTDKVSVTILPDEAWARRVSGVLGNKLANLNPDQAQAVLSFNSQGGYLVSVRAPLTNPMGADELCSLFNTGGGRKNAAGINHLPSDQLSFFISSFAAKYK